MEEMDYNLLFSWVCGLNADDEVWDATTFTKNRDRLQAETAKQSSGTGDGSLSHYTMNTDGSNLRQAV
jgi:Transposase domain (DUF772)